MSHLFGRIASLGGALLLVLGLALPGCGTTSEETRSPRSANSPSPSPLEKIQLEIDAKIKTGEAPSSALAAFGSMWVVNHRGNSIVRIDPGTNKVVATIDAEGDLIGILEAGESLFTLDWQNQKVLRVDPRTNKITSETKVGLEGAAFAYFDDIIWVGSFKGDDGVLLGLDPRSGRIIRRFRYPGAGFIGVGVGAGKLWVGTRTLSPVDTKTGELGTELELEDEAIDIVEGGASLWVSYANHSFITKVDPNSLETQKIEIDAVVIGESDLEPVPDGIAWRVGNKAIAVVSDAGEVLNLYGGLPEQGFASGIAWGFGSLWITNSYTNDVWRVSL